MKCDCNSKKKCDCLGCKPARYGDCSFDIQANPYNSHEWIVTANGMSHRVTLPPTNETDTKLSINSTNATMNYAAERHSDTITGSQIGDIVKLDDLRDVNFDPTFTGTCSELVFRKYADCGEGCESPKDKWSGFNINTTGAKQDYIRYVRGANAYGCPEYLDVPTDLDEYWLAGWKTDGEHKEFGYYQPEYGEIPKDDFGNYIVASVDPDTKKPIYGSLPFDCILRNLMTNLGMDVYGTWSVIQETPAFSADFNPSTGDFTIDWNDWYTATTPWTHCGSGRIYGKVNWVASFDAETGYMNYYIQSIYFDRVVWTVDQGYSGGVPVYFTLKGVSIPTGTETTLLNRRQYSANSNWSETLNSTISCGYTISVAPGQKVGPLNFAYTYIDWTADDEGYLQINFKNKLSGWGVC